ncbi:hypothetical protein IFM89_012409 [Coptis chinensis]|uniref:Uncharacterized protein n=1 Tax=Coptis chinensis TaxID=261450 RepID=A0A835I9S2_9MAGN|nr:hypothetical protein IFM89_012409 [Coptis chinensis]
MGGILSKTGTGEYNEILQSASSGVEELEKCLYSVLKLFDLRKELGIIEEWLYILTKVEEDKLLWHTFDPLSKKWQRLPPMPPVAKGEEPRKVYAVDGCLYVLGGFSRASAVKKEGGFDVIKKAIMNMSLRHQNHISAYREGNERRMTSREA